MNEKHDIEYLPLPSGYELHELPPDYYGPVWIEGQLRQFAELVAANDTALLRQALEALEAMQSYAAAERKGLLVCDEAIIALQARLEGKQ